MMREECWCFKEDVWDFSVSYFGIGIKLMRRLAENHLSEFAIYLGNRYLIVRPRFEEYVLEHMANGGKEFK